MGKKWHIKLLNTLKNRRPAGIWKLCCWIHILAWIYCSSIVFPKALVLDGSLQYVKCAPNAAILQFFYSLASIDTVEFNRLLCPNDKDVRWCNFRWSIPLSIDYVWKSCIDRVISTPSCSYCIRNGYCQNHRGILPNFQLFVWLYTVEFNRLPNPNDKIYDDVVIADRFRYLLAMFANRKLIVLSRLLHAHIAYETDTDKIIAAFCRIFYCLHDLISVSPRDILCIE